MTILGPILLLALAAVAGIAWVMGGQLALFGVGVGIFIASVPCWIPYQAAKQGKDHGKAVLLATGLRFLSALVVALIAELSQPRETARTFLLGMAAAYLVLLVVETIYFSRRPGSESIPTADTVSSTSPESPSESEAVNS